MEDETYSIDCQEQDGSWYFEGTYATYALATDAVQRLLGPLQKPAVRLYRGAPSPPASRQEVGNLRTALAAPVSHDREMEMDIAAWVETLGFDEVLSALITTCHYWATQKETPPIEGPNELWTARERALRHAQWEAKR